MVRMCGEPLFELSAGRVGGVQVEQPGGAGAGDTPAPSSLWQRGSQWLWGSVSLDQGSRPSSARVPSHPHPPHTLEFTQAQVGSENK